MSDNREDQPVRRLKESGVGISVKPFPKADSLFSNFDLFSETYNKNGPKDDLKNTDAGPTLMVSNTVLRQSQGLFKGHGYGFGLEQSHQCSAELFFNAAAGDLHLVAIATAAIDKLRPPSVPHRL